MRICSVLAALAVGHAFAIGPPAAALLIAVGLAVAGAVVAVIVGAVRLAGARPARLLPRDRRTVQMWIWGGRT